MLPASLNSKNRLFIERDSKHRRITANVGSTVRNSKWNSYTLKNTNTLDRSNYIRGLWVSIKLILGILLSYYGFLYMMELEVVKLFIGGLSSHIDFKGDSPKHWRHLLPLIWHYTWRFVADQIFDFIFNPNPKSFWDVVKETAVALRVSIFGQTLSTFEPQEEDPVNLPTNPPLQSVTPAPHLTTHSADLLTTALMQIATQSNSKIPFDNFPVRELFGVLRYWPDHQRPVIRLKRSAYEANYNGVLPMYMPDYRPTELPYKRRYRSQEIEQWLPSYGRNARTFKTDSGDNFYFADLDYQTLNELALFQELPLTSLSVVQQGNAAKILRWSYRYNLLHRKTMINSHKLTSAKKLLGPGFFDSTSSRNNLWFSEVFSREHNFDSSSVLKQLNAHWRLMYKSTLGFNEMDTVGMKNFRDIQQSFNFLCYYESSFHFLLKRVSTFLTLGSNTFSSTPRLNSNRQFNTRVTNADANNAWRLLVTHLGRSITVNEGTLNPLHSNLTPNTSSTSTGDINFTKDIVAPTWDYDLLADDQLDLLLNITTTLTGDTHNVNFFEVDFSSQAHYTLDLNFVTMGETPFNFYKLFFTLLHNEQSFLKDLHLLSSLYSGKRS